MKEPPTSFYDTSSSEGNDPEASSRSALKATVEIAMRSDELTTNQSPPAPASASVAADIESGSPPNAIRSDILRNRIVGIEGGASSYWDAYRRAWTMNQLPLAPAGDSVAADIESGSPNLIRSNILRNRIVGIEGGREGEVNDFQNHCREYAICYAIFLLFLFVSAIVFRSICNNNPDSCRGRDP
jgi:hypothetical protein